MSILSSRIFWATRASLCSSGNVAEAVGDLPQVGGGNRRLAATRCRGWFRTAAIEIGRRGTEKAAFGMSVRLSEMKPIFERRSIGIAIVVVARTEA